MCAFLLAGQLLLPVAAAEAEKDLGLQLSENPVMQTIAEEPPVPPDATETFETRKGFTLIRTLDEFGAAIKKDGQKIRMKPGVYRAEDVDPPLTVPMLHEASGKDGKVPQNVQQHIFAVTGSNNHFDLRGVVFETPVSVQSRLSGRAHVSDSWHINGANNIFEGGYFQNVTVVDTTVKRMRGCFQLLCIGDVTLENVTVLAFG